LNSPTLLLPQDRETDLTTLQAPHCQIRYAYARSDESQLAGENGQDELCFNVDEQRVCFALCDGVSMSFMGDLAAAFLSRALVEWWLNVPTLKLADRDLSGTFTAFINGLTGEAMQRVAGYKFPPDLAPMFVEVLEQKRALGSESMFVSGVIDFSSKRIALTWMGDSRLRIWHNTQDLTQQNLGKAFQTNERWSSRRGCIGQTHIWQSKLSAISRLAAYSDGLAILDGKMDSPYALSTLQQITRMVHEMPNSDDLSYFEVILPENRVSL
jgi:hypothetical protein